MNCGRKHIVYDENLLISILHFYNFSVEIMHALDISNYLTPRYLAELIDNNEYHVNLRNYGLMHDWDVSIALETIYLEIGLRQCGLPPEIILNLIWRFTNSPRDPVCHKGLHKRLSTIKNP